jgi:hypothetical protein
MREMAFDASRNPRPRVATVSLDHRTGSVSDRNHPDRTPRLKKLVVPLMFRITERVEKFAKPVNTAAVFWRAPSGAGHASRTGGFASQGRWTFVGDGVMPVVPEVIDVQHRQLRFPDHIGYGHLPVGSNRTIVDKPIIRDSKVFDSSFVRIHDNPELMKVAVAGTWIRRQTRGSVPERVTRNWCTQVVRDFRFDRTGRRLGAMSGTYARLRRDSAGALTAG